MTDWSFPGCPAPPDFPLDWPAILERWAPIRDLAGCAQDAVHHAEGDVLVHTRMVCEALVGIPDWRALDTTRRSVVFAGALFHDVAKPLTSRDEGGTIRTTGHSRRGAHLVRRLLYAGPEPAPFEAREAIAGLVRHHGLPLWFVDRESPLRPVLAAAEAVRLDHLALVAEADARGRACADPADLRARLDLFREYARENGCWEAPRPFPSDLARARYFEGRQEDPDYAPYDPGGPEVLVLAGLPGAGKDTWLAENRPDLPVVSLDEIRRAEGIDPGENQGAVAWAARERAREYLRHGRPFAWNATNVTRDLRARVLSGLAAFPARFRIVYVETPWRTLLDRNRTREHPVPERVIDRLLDRLDVPDRTEALGVELAIS